MRHRKAGVKLGRTASHRQAMFRNMVTSLLKHGRIRTTDVKAKELRRWADHIVTLAKRGNLHARRQALSIVREKNVVHKLFEDAAERFGSSGGYTRITKIGRRAGDAAPMSLVELAPSGAGGAPPKSKVAAPMEIETPDLKAPVAPVVETAPDAAPEADFPVAEAAPAEEEATAAKTPVAEETESVPDAETPLAEKKTDA